MAEKVFLHLGTPKSGTTYVQAVLGSNRERLKNRGGLLFPGRRWVDQVNAARDVLGVRQHGHRPAEASGAWDRLVDEVLDWHGNAVISMEWLGSAKLEQAERMVASLAPARVEIVVTTRDLARTLPAAWQEFIQNWETWTWREFLNDISGEPMSTPAGRLFWSQQDLGRLLAIWSDVVDADRIHLVTLPPSGTPVGELWARFASVLEIEPHQYDASGGGGNESLGLESTELMRRLNLLSKQDGMTWPDYDARMKHGLAKRGLSRRKGLENTVTIPEEFHAWVNSRSDEQVAAIQASGAHVVGEISDLTPQFPETGPQPVDVPADALLESALAGLVFVASDHATEVNRLKRRIARLEGRPEPEVDHRRLRDTLVDMSEEHRAVMAARRIFVSVRNACRRR